MTHPPRFAVVALRHLCPRDALLEVEGDLQEAFSDWTESRGMGYARRRYWKEVALLGIWRVRGRRGSNRAAPGGSGKGNGGDRWTHDALADVRYGFRRLLKNPVSTAVGVLLLAIGVGGSAMVFTVVDELLLEPPPMVRAPEELVGLSAAMEGRAILEYGYYDYEYYRDFGEAFSGILAYGGFPGSRGRRTDEGGGEVAVRRGDRVEQAGAWVVSGSYFAVLGVPMGVGVGFSPGVRREESEAAEVVLSHGYWSRAFGGDPSVLDRPLYLNGVPFRVVGVTPEDFEGINPAEPMPDLFIPILSAEAISPGFHDQLLRFQADGSASASRFLRLVARLAPGMDLTAAQAEAEVLQRRWGTEFASWAESVYGSTYSIVLRREFNMAPWEATLLRRQLVFLGFVVGAVLLIGCANLAILLLASAAGREREIGIRASLGAGRRRLLSQLITESLILSFLGGLVGLGMACLTGSVLPATLAMNTDRTIMPDGTVLLFVLLLSTLAALLFGTAPAWKLARVDVSSLLQRPGQGRTRAWGRGGLVVGQTVLSVLLLICGGLLARSVQATQAIDLGWNPDRKLVISLLLDNAGYGEEEGLAFLQGALDRLDHVPGVRSATVANRLPFLGSNTWTFTAPGTDFAQEGLRTTFNLVGPDYFRTVGMEILAGRGITREDVVGSPGVVVVNEALAQQFWPGESPIGRTLDFIDQSWRVVGVARNAVYHSPTERPRTHAFFSSLQLYQGRNSFIVATEAPTSTMVAPAEEALQELNPNLTMSRMTLAGLVREQFATWRIWAALISVIAAVALFLAVIGLYGVQSFLVSQRTKEIGVRMALGAKKGRIVGGVVGRGLFIGILGVAIGVGVALALSGVLRGMVFGVAPNDPLVFTVVPSVLLVSCILTSLVPALRASGVDPVQALRRE